jgi:hypothetical protein
MMDRAIELTINDDQSLTVPAEIYNALAPGVHLVVEEKSNGNIRLRLSTPQEKLKEDISSDEEGPRLVERDGLLVIEGKVEEGFDWEAFHHQYREATMHGWDEWEDL